MEPRDLEALKKWENNSNLWESGETIFPFSEHQLLKFIENGTNFKRDGQLRFIIELNEHQAVGAVDLFNYEPTHLRAGLGILIAHDQQQKGYASEALLLLEEYTKEILLLHQLYADVSASNGASRKLFEKLNYSTAGVYKDWYRKPNRWEDRIAFQKII